MSCCSFAGTMTQAANSRQVHSTVNSCLRSENDFRPRGTVVGQPRRVNCITLLKFQSWRVQHASLVASTGKACICPRLKTAASVALSYPGRAFSGSNHDPSAFAPVRSSVRLNAMLYWYANRMITHLCSMAGNGIVWTQDGSKRLMVDQEYKLAII